jgi:hemolysin D
MNRSLQQFLPALLEIQESPPNPIARYLLATILAFVVIAVVWSCVGKVDVVSIAQGQIIPSARVKQVQPLLRGVVQEIHVREGQHVKAGDVLVVLSRTSTAAERERIVGELQAVEAVLTRNRAMLARLKNNPPQSPLAKEEMGSENSSPDKGRLGGVASLTQQSLLEQQYEQFFAQYAALQSQRENRTAERDVNKATIKKLEATLPLAAQRAANIKALADKKLAMENDYLALEEMRLSQENDLVAAKARDVQLAAAVKESEQQLASLLAQTQVQTLTAIADSERQLNALQESLVKAQDADDRQVLYAPVSGEVKDLAINTVGGVVLEAQQLMLIVPEEEKLEVEAWLPNRDIGFVQEGAAAQIKVHTFPFSKYGTIPATVTRISNDVAAADKQKNNSEKSSEAVYSMSVVMEKNTLQVDGRTVTLVPGMQVTAEIITHQRRLIEYFFSPLKKQFQESVRER